MKQMTFPTIAWLPLLLAFLEPIESFTTPCYQTTTQSLATRTRTRSKSTRSAGVGLRMATTYDYALLFDCDGVILETEEFHRLAYNAAFEHAGLTINGEPVVWSVEYYGTCGCNRVMKCN